MFHDHNGESQHKMNPTIAFLPYSLSEQLFLAKSPDEVLVSIYLSIAFFVVYLTFSVHNYLV